jgi:hypothetical protein
MTAKSITGGKIEIKMKYMPAGSLINFGSIARIVMPV